MSEKKPTEAWISRYRRAARDLSVFVVEQAEKTRAETGFGWVAVPDAPGTYPLLTAAHKRSVQTGEALPVSSLYCDNVIYQGNSVNYAMRFWHDTLHITTGLTFALDDELELGLHHLTIAERAGIKKGSMEWQMLRIDMLGQNYLLGIAKRFPIEQDQFVKGCLLYGLDEGVLREARLT